MGRGIVLDDARAQQPERHHHAAIEEAERTKLGHERAEGERRGGNHHDGRLVHEEGQRRQPDDPGLRKLQQVRIHPQAALRGNGRTHRSQPPRSNNSLNISTISTTVQSVTEAGENVKRSLRGTSPSAPPLYSRAAPRLAPLLSALARLSPARRGEPDAGAERVFTLPCCVLYVADHAAWRRPERGSGGTT